MEAGGQWLENWERWEELRRRAGERLGILLDRPPSRLLMNREQGWHQRKRASLYRIDLERAPRASSETTLGEIAKRCLKTSLIKFRPSVKKKSVVKDLEPSTHVPDYKNLKIVGTRIWPPRPVKAPMPVPRIVIDEEEDCRYDEMYEPVLLMVGPVTIGEGDSIPITCRVEMLPVSVMYTQAREVRITNKGTKAISYYWRKENTLQSNLPLKYLRGQMSKFHFNKNEGILLPGQSFVHRFMFYSKVPGVFNETWALYTSPRLPKVIFQLVGVSSRDPNSPEESRQKEVEEYLEKCIKESTCRELVESLLERVVPPVQSDYSSYFLEKEIFMEVNPTLQYDMDCVRQVKELHSTFSTKKWNYSMLDLCELLLERTSGEERNKVMGNYCELLGRMHRKPVVGDPKPEDWDRLKTDLCYLVLCSAVAQMEACLRRENWGLPPPPQPPGPKDEYCGEMFDTEADPEVPAEGEAVPSYTDDEEERLAVLEEPRSTDSLELEYWSLHTGPVLQLEGKEGVHLPPRRWGGRRLNDEVSLETGSKAGGSRKTRFSKSPRASSNVQKAAKIVPMNQERGSCIPPRRRHERPAPTTEELKFHRAFQVLQWREILSKAAETLVGIVEHIRVLRGPAEERYYQEVQKKDPDKTDASSDGPPDLDKPSYSAHFQEPLDTE